jgi:hypothetical protein
LWISRGKDDDEVEGRIPTVNLQVRRRAIADLGQLQIAPLFGWWI